MREAVQLEATRRALAADPARPESPLSLLTEELLRTHLPVGSVVRLAASHLPAWYCRLFEWPAALDGRAVVGEWYDQAFVTFRMGAPGGGECSVSLAWHLLEQACLADALLEAQ